MKQLKKTLLTLVALLAVTTGAWATEFTSLKVGDVLHVGDAINTGTNYTVYGLYLDAGYQPATLVRANIGTNDITESETGAYYLIKGKNDFYYGIIWGEGLEGGYWPVTDTSDGISVTAITPGDYTELTFAVHEGSATPVDGFDWNGETNTGTFTMPGGNVTLEPDYYPQATVAEGAVTAAGADARATTDDPLVKVDATKLTGAKELMYFVSNSGTTAPAYDAEGWTEQLPTAESITQQGIVYVYYYPVGTDEGVDGATATYSDGDMNATALEVNIAAAPTYAVTFADDTAEPTLWTAEPNAGVTKGQTVTVTYTGSKKVIGVKAEKKAAPTYTLLSAATTSDYGKVVCAAGHLHDAKTAVPDGCTAVGILGKVTETGHGLILSLQDATQQTWNTIDGWTSASYAGTTLKVLPDDAARGTNLTSYTALGETTVSNWAVAQIEDYDAIFTNLGSTKSNSGMLYDDNVNDYITTGVGGTAISGDYWSATEYEDHGLTYNNETWQAQKKKNSKKIRPVLGF